MTTLIFPPPHYILFEPLNDQETLNLWSAYKSNNPACEYQVIDAAKINSIENFSPLFEGWITRKSSHRVRILLILHSEFLTFACQQVLRRLLEERSYKCRVFFHVEDPTSIQPAIHSRCVVKRIQTHIHKPRVEILK